MIKIFLCFVAVVFVAVVIGVETQHSPKVTPPSPSPVVVYATTPTTLPPLFPSYLNRSPATPPCAYDGTC